MASEIYEKYNLYNPATFAIKLMRSIELFQNSNEFREKFKKNLNLVNHKGDYYVISQILQQTLDQVTKNLKQNRTVNFLIGDEKFDMRKILHSYTKSYQPLVLSYKGEINDENLSEVLNEFHDHLKYFGLQDKNLIAVNFPRNKSELNRLKEIPIKPNRVVLIHNNDTQVKCEENFLNFVKKSYPNETKEIYAENVKEMCKKVRKCFEFSEPTIKSKFVWLPRVCLIGATGSGAKLQGKLISKSCGLIFVDAEVEIERWKNKSVWFETESDRDYLHSSIIYERLMQSDCLRYGYALVNFPKNQRQFKYILEMIIAPNRLVFFNATKNVCLKRKRKQLMKAECMNESQLECHMKNLEKEIEKRIKIYKEMKACCKGLREKVEINANRSIKTVELLIRPQIIQNKNY